MRKLEAKCLMLDARGKKQRNLKNGRDAGFGNSIQHLASGIKLKENNTDGYIYRITIKSKKQRIDTVPQKQFGFFSFSSGEKQDTCYIN